MQAFPSKCNRVDGIETESLIEFAFMRLLATVVMVYVSNRDMSRREVRCEGHSAPGRLPRRRQYIARADGPIKTGCQYRFGQNGVRFCETGILCNGLRKIIAPEAK